MKKLAFCAFLCLSVFAACVNNDSDMTPQQIQDKLKSVMTDYLYKDHGNDSSKVKYDVFYVAYFADPDKYICEFKVRMKLMNNIDTIGFMKAYISKDFKTVKRNY